MKFYKYYSLKALQETEDERGGYEGEPSPFGSLDDGGDIIPAGAYKQDLDFFKQCGFGTKDHRWTSDGNIAYPIEAKETQTGLYIKMRFHGTDDAQAVRTKVKERLADNLEVKLSIGYELLEPPIVIPASKYATELPKHIRKEWLADALEKAKGFRSCRVLKRIKLYEVAIVTVPMETRAAVTSAKSALVKHLGPSSIKNLLAQHFASRLPLDKKDMLTDYFDEWTPSFWELTDGLWTVCYRIKAIIAATDGANIDFDPMAEWQAALAVFDQFITEWAMQKFELATEEHDYYYLGADGPEETKEKQTGLTLEGESSMMFSALKCHAARGSAIARSMKDYSARLSDVTITRFTEKSKTGVANEQRIKGALQECEEVIASMRGIQQEIIDLAKSVRVTVSVSDQAATPAPAATNDTTPAADDTADPKSGSQEPVAEPPADTIDAQETEPAAEQDGEVLKQGQILYAEHLIEGLEFLIQ